MAILRFPAVSGVLLAALLGAAPASGGPEIDPVALPHKIAIDARGPIALVEVTRTVAPTRSEGSDGAEAVLDLALPEQSTLIGVEVQDQGRWRKVDPSETAYAADLYRSESAARGVTPAYEPIDDSALFRLRLARAAGARATAPINVRYRFAASAVFSNGRHRLRFPAAPERLPSPAEVTVQTRDGGDVEIAGAKAKPGAPGRASTRSGWETSWALRDPAPAGDEPTLSGRLAAAPSSASEIALAYEVRSRPGRPISTATSVLFVVDRSRSVGLPGLSAERDLARRLLESLPPDVRFDVLFFDRATKRLFPMSRPATRESIDAFESEMVADRLQNGTDPVAALREAGALLRREAAAFGPRALLVFISDGALPDKQDGPSLERALGKTPGLDLTVAAFSVRPDEEEAVSPGARQALQHFAAAHGGVARELRIPQIGDVVPTALADITRGGDIVGVHVLADGREKLLAEVLPPGGAVSGVASLPGRIPRALQVHALVRGRRVSLPVQVARVPAAWLGGGPHSATGGDKAKAGLLVGTSLVTLVEPIVRAAPAPEPVVRGSMDRLVMRNVLSLAYMPRARACYLNRSGATPAARDLTGKVRLALEVVRGEVEHATIESSSLGDPKIEACLQEGAFAIDVPRAWRSDAPVTAILNMSFRPYTYDKDKKGSRDLGVVGDQIDLMIEEALRGDRAEAPRPAESPPAPGSRAPSPSPAAPLPPR